MDTKSIIRYNDYLRDKVEELEKQIKEFNKNIIDNEEKLFDTCKHEWSVDNSDFESSADVCRKCGLYNNEYIYHR